MKALCQWGRGSGRTRETMERNLKEMQGCDRSSAERSCWDMNRPANATRQRGHRPENESQRTFYASESEILIAKTWACYNALRNTPG